MWIYGCKSGDDSLWGRPTKEAKESSSFFAKIYLILQFIISTTFLIESRATPTAIPTSTGRTRISEITRKGRWRTCVALAREWKFNFNFPAASFAIIYPFSTRTTIWIAAPVARAMVLRTFWKRLHIPHHFFYSVLIFNFCPVRTSAQPEKFQLMLLHLKEKQATTKAPGEKKLCAVLTSIAWSCRSHSHRGGRSDEGWWWEIIVIIILPVGGIVPRKKWSREIDSAST